ncbi:hypothetical protein ACZ11_11675 [Lysinibacillus xylanilyticus]|uniref:Uncharacterized protein n=1 Tax=Lysinibacillus xylanilyticus TaxID=582475 RepID=A0A0K9FF24_9BACI|nr:hypothetical protein ACZ11_11675 [Lysinibacillus xylanilyticus]
MDRKARKLDRALQIVDRKTRMMDSSLKIVDRKWGMLDRTRSKSWIGSGECWIVSAQSRG